MASPPRSDPRGCLALVTALVGAHVAAMIAAVAGVILFVCLAVLVLLGALGYLGWQTIGPPPELVFEQVRVLEASGPLGQGAAPEIEVRARTPERMPALAPAVEVQSRCLIGGRWHSGEDQIFSSSFNGAAAGTRRVARARPYFANTLPRAPDICRITLQQAGARGPTHYCYREGTLSPGDCPAEAFEQAH